MSKDSVVAPATPPMEMDGTGSASPRGVPQQSPSDVLLALADRCEREEPSHDLDADIALANGWRVFPGDNWIGPHAQIAVPSYTTSLDAAVTLVPEHFSYEATFSAAGDGAMRRARLWDWRRSARMADPDNHWEASASTLPLAICAAALRARASEGPR